MYRVKITHCAPIIENIYGANYPYYCKDKKDLYIEVRTGKEEYFIDLIEQLQATTFKVVELLNEEFA